MDELSGSCRSPVGPAWMYECVSSNQTPDLLLCDDKSKHVSFDTSLVRSNTIGGGIDSGSGDPCRLIRRGDVFLEDGRAASALTTDPNLNISHERLMSAGFAISPIPPDQHPASSLANMSLYTLTPSSSNSLRLIKRTTIVKTRATQTEVKSKSGRFKGSSKSVAEAAPGHQSYRGTSATPVVKHDEAGPTLIIRDQSPDPLAYLTLSPRTRRRVMGGKSLVSPAGKVNYHYHKHSFSKKNSPKTTLAADEERSLSGLEAETGARDAEQQNAGQIECWQKRGEMDADGIRNEGEEADEEEGAAVSLQSSSASKEETVRNTGRSGSTTEGRCLEARGERRESASLLEKSKRSLSGSSHTTTSIPVVAGHSRAAVIQRQRSASSCKQEKKRRREQWQSMKYLSCSSDDEDERDADRLDTHRRHSIADAGAVHTPALSLPAAGAAKKSELVNDAVETAADVGERIDPPAQESQQSAFCKMKFGEKISLLESHSPSSQAIDRISKPLEEQLSDDDISRSQSKDRERDFLPSYDSPALISEPIASVATESASSASELKSLSDVCYKHELAPVLSSIVASDDSSISQTERANDQKAIRSEKGQEEEPDSDERRRQQEEVQQQCMQSFMGSLPSPSSEEVSASSHLIELTSPEDEIECELGKESGSSVYVTATDRTPRSSSKSKTATSTAAEKTTTYETASSSLFSLYSSPASSFQRKSSQESGTDSHLSPTRQEDIDSGSEPQVSNFSGNAIESL